MPLMMRQLHCLLAMRLSPRHAVRAGAGHTALTMVPFCAPARPAAAVKTDAATSAASDALLDDILGNLAPGGQPLCAPLLETAASVPCVLMSSPRAASPCAHRC